MDVKFVYGEPAALIGKNLIIADVHFGIEALSLSYSVAIKRIRKNIEKIRRLVEKFDAKRLIVTGDFKHKIPKEEKDEEVNRIESRISIREIIKEIENFVDLTIVGGNHDGGIREKVNELVVDGIGIIHGHRWPSEKILKCRKIICSHIHPFYTIESKFGKKRERVFLIGQFTEKFYEDYERKFRKKINQRSKVIVIPPFNDLATGRDVRDIDRGLFSKKRFKIVSIYLLDGIKINYEG
jgi:putative SbcD/Mre11-related phosphoesterase